jgi:hypothetical protein
MFHVLISVLGISTWCVLLPLGEIFSLYLRYLGMDWPNSIDHLPCAPPITTWTFSLGWFCGFHPGDTGANLRDEAPPRNSEKKYGLDR